MRPYRLALCAITSLLLAGCAARAPHRSPEAAASAQITAASLAGPTRFLADDLFAGRGPGTREDALARAYIAAEMETIGLRPGAADDGWEQPVELVGVSAEPPPAWDFFRGDVRLRLDRRDDFVAASAVVAPRARIDDAELVFVGYGIQAPEYGWDDFKGVDLRGKVLVMLNDDPDWDPTLFAGRRRLYYGRWTYKYESAARAGAIGAIIVHTPASAGYPWQTVQTSWSGENSRLAAGADAATTLQVQAWVSELSAQAIATLAGTSLAALTEQARRADFAPVPLGITTSLTLQNTLRHYATANVIGVLPGSDPALAQQAVVYTAHHDHLGSRHDADGQAVIFNGALDNATGIAQLLGVARAFAAAPAPKRSVLFIAVAAEEQGLLGSAYYVQHPTVPPAQMVAAINFDAANIWGRTRDVASVGYGKSTLDRWAGDAASAQGRVLVNERFPERGSFYRSDQFNFARIGVPVLYARSGVDFIGRPPDWGREQVDRWTAEHYHQPSDDFDPSWNFDGMVEDTQLNFSVGYALAQSAELPSWTPGDEFEAARLQNR
jgi:Zn-dependent M28 family amino/carboxypeptidase